MKKIVVSMAVLLLSVAPISAQVKKSKNQKSSIKKERKMQTNQKNQVITLLKSIETGATEPVAVINPNQYVQHNLAVGDVENGKIAEHWDAIEPIPAKENWKNQNGKFNF